MNLSAQFKQFLSSQGSSASKATVKNYIADVNKFIKWFETKFNRSFSPSEITESTITSFKSDSLEKYSASSVDRSLSSLRKFFTFLKNEGQITHSPFDEKPKSETEIQKDLWRVNDFKNYLYVFNASHLTIKNYIIDLKQFISWAEEVLKSEAEYEISESGILSQVDSNLINEYKKRLLNEAKLSPVSVNRKLSSLRKYFSWAEQEGIIKPDVSVLNEAGIADLDENFGFKLNEDIAQDSARASLNPDNSYSKFPPIRLAQKISRGAILFVDGLLILPLVALLHKVEYGTWKMRGRPVIEAKSAGILGRALSNQPQNTKKIKNVGKEFYAPAKVSLKYYPLHKKVIFHAKYTRPDWYKRYQNTSFIRFVQIAILVILFSALSYALYSNLGPNKNQTKSLAALPTAPPRVLSFQGRLTDATDNPITTPTAMRMAIYDTQAASGSSLLWQEIVTVTPDSDGIFATLLGNNTTIPQSVFAQNSALWLGVTVGTTPELAPRQQIATVAFATNSETLQGLEPITNSSSTTNVVLALNSSGNLSIGGSASPVFQSTGGSFTLQGTSLILSTTTGSGGNVRIAPDGLGKIDLQKPIQNNTITNNLTTARGSVEIDDLFSILATSSGQSAFTLNQDSTGPLISASTSGVAKFTVDNGGNLTTAGTINGLTVSNGTITSGTWNASPIGSQYGGTGINTSSSTGVPYISSGTWSVDSNFLAVNHGGTGLGTYTTGDLIYASGTTTLAKLGVGTASQCLIGGTLPTWATCSTGSGGTNWWTTSTDGKALTPINSTMDFLLGGQATTSAKFSVLNLNSGTPVASVSSQTGTFTPALLLSSDGSIQTNRFNTLTIGGNTTGNVNINNKSASPFTTFDTTNGRVGIGTTTPRDSLEVVGGNIFSRTSGTGSSTSIQAVSNDYASTFQAAFLQYSDSGVAGTTLGLPNADLASIGFQNASNALIFTNGATPIAFGTSSLERLRISSTGQFGIGTTSPASELHVTRPLSFGTTGTALAIFDQIEQQDIFTASASGTPIFTITRAGGISLGTNGLNVGNSSQCLLGGTPASWGSCGAAGTNWWTTSTDGKALTPINSTMDFLLGGQATTSAKFSVLGLNSARGSQTASISGSIVLDSSTASFQTTMFQSLSIGGNTTGNVNINNKSGTAFTTFDTTNSRVGIGTNTPTAALQISGGGNLFLDSGAIIGLDQTNPTFWGLRKNGVDIEMFGGGGAGSAFRVASSQTGNLGLAVNFSDQNVGIGTESQVAQLQVTRPLSYGANGMALAILNQIEQQDIFTASAAGTPIFTITRAGGISLGTNGLNVGTTSQCLIGGSTATWGSCATGLATNWWTTSSDGKALTPINSTMDFLLGSQATASAKFAFTGLSSATNQTQASISGTLVVMPNNGYGGNFGLGNATPNRQMQIVGPSQLTASLTDSGNIGGTLNLSGSVDTANSGGTLAFSALNDNGLYTPQSAIKSLLSNGSQNGVGDLVISTRNLVSDTSLTERLRIVATGNVGIGGDGTPDSLFSVGSTSQFQVNSSGAIAAITGYTQTSGAFAFSGAGNFSIDSSAFDVNTSGAVSGVTTLAASGAITLSNAAYTGNNAVLYGTTSTGVLAAATTSTSGLCLLSGAGAGFAPSWGSCGSSGTNWWTTSTDGKALTPINSTMDFLLGGQATTSAKFSVLNLNSGTPVASVSSQTGTFTPALLLSSDGSIQTNRFNTLTIGGATTGNIAISPLNGATGSTLSFNALTQNWTTTALNAGSLTTIDAAASLSIDSTSWTVGGGAATTFQTSSNANLTHTAAGTGQILLSTDADSGIQIASSIQATPLAPLYVRGGIGNNAAVIINNLNSGDLISASASGTTRFTVATNGLITGANGLTLSAGAITLGGLTGSGQCLVGGATAAWGACSSGGTNWWTTSSDGKALTPINSTMDFLLGSQATASAKFAFTGLSSTTGQTNATISGQLTVMPNTGYGGNASIAADLKIGALVNPIIQTTQNKALTIGGNTTGNIAISPLNGATGSILTVNALTQSWTSTAVSATALATLTSSTSLSLNPNTGTSYTLATSATGLTLFNTNATTITFGQAASTLNIGPSAGTMNLGNGGNYTITTTTNGNLIHAAAGTGQILLSSDFNSGVQIASAVQATPLAPLYVRGGIGNNAAVIINNLNNGDLFTASAAGTTRFTIDTNGNVTQIGATYTIGNGSNSTFTTTTNGNLIHTAAGTGQILLSSDFNSGVQIASAVQATPLAPLYVRGGIGNNAAVIINNTNNGDILVGSVAGTTKFTFDTNGNLGINTNASSTVGVDVAAKDIRVTDGALIVHNTSVSSWAIAQGATSGCGSGASGLCFGFAGTGEAFLSNAGKLTLNSNLAQNGAPDVAENITVVDQSIEAADILAATDSDANNSNVYDRAIGSSASESYQSSVIGVVSSNAGILLNSKINVGGSTDDHNQRALAIAGRIPTKVSTINGPIRVGDPITSSTISKYGMKATRAGTIVGKALEEFDPVNGKGDIIPCPAGTPNGVICGKVLALLNVSFYDPDVTLSDTGSINLTPTVDYNFKVQKNGENVTRIGVYSELVVAKIRGGAAEIQRISSESIASVTGGFQDLTTNTLAIATSNITIAGQSIQDFIANIVDQRIAQNPGNGDIISPLEDDGKDISLKLKTNDNKSKFVVNNASGSAVATIDGVGNASISGQLNAAGASISGTLRADKIIANQIEGLNISGSTLSANYITNNYYISTPSAENNFASQSAYFNQSATQSAMFGDLNAQTATFAQGLMSFGPASFYEASVADRLFVGSQLSLADNSINVLGSELKIQPLKQGDISFMAGLVKIDTDGNLKVDGNAYFAKNVDIHGKLSANIIAPIGKDLTFQFNDASDSGEEASVQFKTGTESAVLSINNKGDLNASGSGTFAKLNLNIIKQAQAVSDTEVNATGSAGMADIKANKNEITINNKSITEDSLIYITPKTSIPNNSVYLIRQIPGESFTVGISSPINKKVEFNWIIIN